jgi:hypothetical protein
MFSCLARAAIDALDLHSVCTRLMHPNAGHGWSRDRTAEAERGYRAFLVLAKMFPHEALAPAADVDAFWHFHILDTSKYAADCEKTFGYFLHHAPDAAPADSAEDVAVRAAMSARTHALYQASFGAITPAADAAYCALTARAGDTAYCALAKPDAGAAYCALTRSDAGAAYCALKANKAATYCAVAGTARDIAAGMTLAASA